MRKVRRLVIASIAAGAMILPAAHGSAAPITCPGGQTATKTSSGWDCVNRGGNPSNAEDPKNTNVGKGFF
jgi:hypothetical protein